MTRVSVLIATMNRLPDLYGCLSSLEQQEGSFEIEACIVNDGGVSIDPVLERFEGSRLRIQFLNERDNVGQVAARNHALAQASGDYVALCDDDDRWLPMHVHTLLDTMNHAQSAMSYTDSELVWLSRSAGRLCLQKRASFAWSNATELLTRYNPIAPSSVLYHRELHEMIGGFDEAVSHYWDWDFWLRILEVGSVSRVPQCHTLYGIYSDGTNLSANPDTMSPFLQRLVGKHGLGPLPTSNFPLMLEDDAIAEQQAATHIAWSGDMRIWTPSDAYSPREL